MNAFAVMLILIHGKRDCGNPRRLDFYVLTIYSLNSRNLAATSATVSSKTISKNVY